MYHVATQIFIALKPAQYPDIGKKVYPIRFYCISFKKKKAETVNPIFHSLWTKNLIGSFVYELLDQTAGEKSPLLDWELTWQHMLL